MNNFYRDNLVVQGNSDETGGVVSVKHVDGNGEVVQTFYDNTPGTKDINYDQASFNFPGEKPLNMQSVPTLGAESNGTLLQSSNVENKNIPNSNTVGVPSLSIPAGFTKDNLPVGIQLHGKKFAEEELLQIGSAYQQVTDWHTRIPELIKNEK